MRIPKLTLLVIAALVFTSSIKAQNVGINTTGAAPNASALLDINTGNVFTSPNGKGLLIPNVALASAGDAVTINLPATSLLVYVPAGSGLAPAGYYYNTGTPALPVWTQLSPAGGGNSWLLVGNAGTVPGPNFLGTTDAEALEFKVDNQKSGWIDYGTTWNTFFGYQAGNAITTGTFNVAFGFNALDHNTTGIENVAVGDFALGSTTTATGVTGVGGSALASNTTGGFNTSVGYYALSNNNTGINNTAVGSNAMLSNVSGNNNTAVGAQSLQNNLTTGNTAVGFQAMFANSTAGQNNALGFQTLYNNTVLSGNLAIGDSSLYTQNYNVAFNSSNIAIGNSALFMNNPTSVFSGMQNVAIGEWAMRNNTTGSQNTAVGAGALYANQIRSENTAIGYDALANMTGQSWNTAVGAYALFSTTSGGENTAVGDHALWFNSSGSDNTATGRYANWQNTFGSDNTTTGSYALYDNTSGSSNTANGQSAMYDNTNGMNNSAMGSQALEHNVAGSSNTSVGYLAGFKTTASLNVFVGDSAGITNTSGTSNTFIGYRADANAGTYTNATALGNGAIVTTNNTVVLGNAAVTTLYCAVTAITAISDGRFKTNIHDDIHGLDFIMKLKPVSYTLNVRKLNAYRGVTETAGDKGSIDEAEKVVHNGFIAQDVEKASQETGYDFSGLSKPKNNKDIYGIGYTDFVVPLVKAVQEQQHMIDSLKAANANLQAENATILKHQADYDTRLKKLEELTGSVTAKN